GGHRRGPPASRGRRLDHRTRRLRGDAGRAGRGRAAGFLTRPKPLLAAAVLRWMPKPKFLSVGFELADLGASVEGVRLLLERLQAPGGRRTPEEVQALTSGLALLSVVAFRLDLLHKAVRREIDPALLLNAENLVANAGGQDVLIGPWSDD